MGLIKITLAALQTLSGGKTLHQLSRVHMKTLIITCTPVVSRGWGSLAWSPQGLVHTSQDTMQGGNPKP